MTDIQNESIPTFCSTDILTNFVCDEKNENLENSVENFENVFHNFKTEVDKNQIVEDQQLL
jgi:hypothetical protein